MIGSGYVGKIIFIGSIQGHLPKTRPKSAYLELISWISVSRSSWNGDNSVRLEAAAARFFVNNVQISSAFPKFLTTSALWTWKSVQPRVWSPGKPEYVGNYGENMYILTNRTQPSPHLAFILAFL